jgi:hypothetical protein
MTSFTTKKCTYLQGLAFVTCVVGTNDQLETALTTRRIFGGGGVGLKFR